MNFDLYLSHFCLQEIYVIHGALHTVGGALHKVPTNALSTHVRYYVPLTVEEYIYMADQTTAPRVSTTKATACMPLYNRINGLLEQSHCYLFLAYMFPNSNVYTRSKGTFYILETYMSQHALHAHVEAKTMCLFSPGPHVLNFGLRLQL